MRSILVVSKIPRLCEHICLNEKFVNLQQQFGFKIDNVSDPVPENKSIIEELVKESEIVLADPSFIAPILHSTAELGSLRWFQSTWAGTESYAKALGARDIIVTRTGGVFAKQMAEYCIAFIVQQERNLSYLSQCQKAREWKPYLEHRTLASLNIGYGSIGKELSSIFNLFGSKVVAYCSDRKKYEKDEHEKLKILSSKEGLLELLKSCDYLINTLPHTPETVGLLNGDILESSQRTLIFINVGRGSIIAEDDLVRALNNQWISGAVLDVFAKEPLDASSVLWSLKNVQALSTKEDISSVFIDNLERYLTERQLNWIVESDKYY